MSLLIMWRFPKGCVIYNVDYGLDFGPIAEQDIILDSAVL